MTCFGALFAHGESVPMLFNASHHFSPYDLHLTGMFSIDRVLIPRFAEVTGYTVKAVERKIESGVWAEGKHWFRNPDGRITVSLKAYEEWQREKPRKPRQRAESRSVATI